MMTLGVLPQESYELIRHGLKIYADVIKKWLELMAQSSKSGPMNVMKPWPAPPFETVEDIIVFSRVWQKNCHRFISRAPAPSEQETERKAS